MRRLAVIDMGSNSFRLVVYSYTPGGAWTLTDEIREAVRVGAGMGDERLLQPGPMERAVSTASVFAAFCRAAGIDDVVAVGTSAIREAVNRDELLDRIRSATGLEVRVISAEDESHYDHLAIANSTTLADGFGLDLGGGSMQLLELRGRELANSVSLPLGAVRVSERFLPGEEAAKKGMKALRRHVAEALGEVAWFPGEHRGARMAGIGGSLRNLAAAAQKRGDFPNTGVQGFLLEREALEELIGELAGRPAAKRGRVPGIKPDRGDVILGAALVVAAVMDAGEIDGIEVSEAGLREGVLFEELLAGEHPPLFDDVRREAVANLGERFRFQPAHVRHVAKLSAEIYDGLADAEALEPDDGERDLLWAACMLHDIGVAIDYDDHHKHSRYLILNAGLPGYSQRELELVALIARYHRKGCPDAGELGALARKGDEERLRLLAGIIRVAEQLERSRDQSVVDVRVRDDAGRLVLEAESRGDARVAVWSASRSAELLSEAIGRPVEVAGVAAAVG